MRTTQIAEQAGYYETEHPEQALSDTLFDDSGNVRSLAEKRVTMSNALTRAGHGLTLAEKRTIMIAISKLDSRATVPNSVPMTKIYASEYATCYEVDKNTAYEQLQTAANNLLNRKIVFYEPAYRRAKNKRDTDLTVVKMNWVGKIKYQKGEGWVELHWWPELKPHLFNLKKQFTTYQLKQATALRSYYSWRLLELLMRFEKTGWVEFSIEDFITSMEIPEKVGENFAHVRRKIIEPAIAELKAKDSWLIQWVPTKQGRRVKKIRFQFTRDPQLQLF